MKEILLHYFILFLVPSTLVVIWHQNENKGSNLITASVFLAGMILSFATLWETEHFNVTIVVCFLLIVLFYCNLVYYQKIAVIECLRQIYVSVSVALVVTATYEIIRYDTIMNLLQNHYWGNVIVIYSLFVGGFLGIETIFHKIITPIVREFFISRNKLWHIFLVFNVLIVKATTLLIILNKSNHSLVITYLFLVTTIVELFFCFVAIRYIAKMYHFSVFRYRHELLNEMYELQLNHLEQLEHKAREIRRLSHDIHNHKIVLHKLMSDQAYDQALAYLDSFDDYELQTANQMLFSEHRIINAMCQQKFELCQSEGIDLQIDISLPSGLVIADFDLCVIFGNLFDNAIEAVKKCPPNQRTIVVRSYLKNQNFVLRMENDFLGEIKQKNKRIMTSKQDKILHGIGLTNVTAAVHKYAGDFSYTPVQQQFVVRIRIPLQ
ncbi:MAG: sensor histidine kinase [Culicoidibacterales bacterium]